MHIICTFSDTFLLSGILILLGAMKNNIDILQRGVLVLLPESDDRGRAIIYFNPSLKRGDDDDKVFNMCWLFLKFQLS